MTHMKHQIENIGSMTTMAHKQKLKNLRKPILKSPVVFRSHSKASVEMRNHPRFKEDNCGLINYAFGKYRINLLILFSMFGL